MRSALFERVLTLQGRSVGGVVSGLARDQTGATEFVDALLGMVVFTLECLTVCCCILRCACKVVYGAGLQRAMALGSKELRALGE